MWRSLQFIPASSEKMLGKADVCGADAIIFDLEDGVALELKEKARDMLRGFLPGFENRNKCGVVVRINPIDTFDADEVEALAATGKIDAFMLPKAGIESIKRLDDILCRIEAELSYKFKIIALIETAMGLCNAFPIATASERMKGMLFGAEDYLTQMGVERSTEGNEISVARHLHAIACVAAGIEAYDTPFTDYKDLEALEADARTAKNAGMTGKAAIHPFQVPVINSVYSPSGEDIKKAERIVKAAEEARKEGKGAFEVDGKMVDAPIIQRALYVLKLSEGGTL